MLIRWLGLTKIQGFKRKRAQCSQPFWQYVSTALNNRNRVQGFCVVSYMQRLTIFPRQSVVKLQPPKSRLDVGEMMSAF